MYADVESTWKPISAHLQTETNDAHAQWTTIVGR